MKSKSSRNLDIAIKELRDMRNPKDKKASKLEKFFDNIKDSAWYQKYIWKGYKVRSFKSADELIASLNDNAIYQNIYYMIRRNILRVVEAPGDFLRDLKWDLQRAERGFGDNDVWNMYGYIAEVNYKMLVDLKENKMGFPLLAIDDKDSVDETGNLTEEASDKCQKRWDDILDKIIYAWKLNMEIGNGDREMYLPKLKKEFNLKYHCLSKEEEKQRLEGIKLYNKYFFNLWD